MAKSAEGFVSLKTLKKGPPSSSGEVLGLLRRIYFKTTRETIEHDFNHAIELLKSLQSEEDREKATAYMHGLAELRKEWSGGKKRRRREGRVGRGGS